MGHTGFRFSGRASDPPELDRPIPRTKSPLPPIDVNDQLNSIDPAQRSRRASGILLLIATSVLWSLSGVVVKKVNLPPTMFALWRALAAGLAVLPLVGFSKAPWPRGRWLLVSIAVYTAVVSLLITA